MYLYYDRYGTLKEQIVFNPARVGNSNVNKIFVYWEGVEEFPDWAQELALQTRYLLQDNTQYPSATTFGFSAQPETAELPFDKNQDLKYFKYYKEYKFLTIDIPDEVLSYNGAVKSYIWVLNANKKRILGLGVFAFMVDGDINEVIPDENISLAQWNMISAQLGLLSGSVIDVTCDIETNTLKVYYANGLTAIRNLPPNGAQTTISSDFLQEMIFSTDAWVQDGENGYYTYFRAETVGYTDNRFFVQLEKDGEYNSDYYNKTGSFVLSDNIFKGSDGSVLLYSNEPYSGRLLVVGGKLLSGDSLVTGLTYNDVNSQLTYKTADGITHSIYLGIDQKLNISDIVQTTGQSTDKVMSQKAITDEIDALKSDLADVVGPDYIVPEITGWFDGGYISTTDGEVVAYSSYHYTDYIGINPFLGPIKFTNSGPSYDIIYNAWYDENKAFIKSFSTKSDGSIVIQPPFNAKFMRLSFNKTTENTVSAEYIYGSMLENSIWNGLSNYIRSKFLLGWFHNGDGSYSPDSASIRSTIITPLHFNFDITISVNSGYQIALQLFDGYETGSSHLQSSTGWLDNILIPKGSYFCITFRASDDSALTNASIENLSALGYANNSDIYAKLMPVFDKYMEETTVPTDYLLGVGFDKKHCALSLLGSISGAQSFCIYNDKFYSTDGSNLYEQGSDLSLISTTALSLGHGNALQLGHNGKAYASGWNDNSVYIVDLVGKEITGTITLPVTGYTTCAVDDINELIYIFHRTSYPDTIATYTLTVYDYANNKKIRTSKITRQFAAMQGCDFVDGKIFVMYGLGSSSAPNGYVIFDTSGNILAEYIIASKSTLEPEGICVDRSTNDIYISYLNKKLYKINFV